MVIRFVSHMFIRCTGRQSEISCGWYMWYTNDLYFRTTKGVYSDVLTTQIFSCRWRTMNIASVVPFESWKMICLRSQVDNTRQKPRYIYKERSVEVWDLLVDHYHQITVKSLLYHQTGFRYWHSTYGSKAQYDCVNEHWTPRNEFTFT